MLRLPPFELKAPATTAEAVRLKRDAGALGAYVAGGTDLYPNMKRRQQTPRLVIDIRRLPGLGTIAAAADGSLLIGSAVSLSRLIRDPLVRRSWPVLARAAATISTPLLQNMGTVGGNLLLDTRCNYYDQSYEWRQAIDFCMKKDGTICWVAPSSPRCWAVQSSDLAPVMVALEAKVRVVGLEGERTIPAAALYQNDGIDYLTLRPDELLTAIEIPSLVGARADYQKLRRRGAFDFPVLGVATWARVDQAGVLTDARVVLGAVASYPVMCREAAQALVGQRLSDDVVDQAAHTAARPAKPLDNTDFTIGWRKEMVPVFVRRSLLSLRSA